MKFACIHGLLEYTHIQSMPVARSKQLLQGRMMPDKLQNSQSLPPIRCAEQFRLPLSPVFALFSSIVLQSFDATDTASINVWDQSAAHSLAVARPWRCAMLAFTLFAVFMSTDNEKQQQPSEIRVCQWARHTCAASQPLDNCSLQTTASNENSTQPTVC